MEDIGRVTKGLIWEKMGSQVYFAVFNSNFLADISSVGFNRPDG